MNDPEIELLVAFAVFLIVMFLGSSPPPPDHL